jgi:hypothetical protein
MQLSYSHMQWSLPDGIVLTSKEDYLDIISFSLHHSSFSLPLIAHTEEQSSDWLID